MIFAIPIAYWALGGAALGTAVWMSPAGKPARDATARALNRALTRDRTDVCTTCNVCPHCGRPMADPPGTPDYINSNRKIIANDTFLRGLPKAPGVPPVKGAPVYQYNGGYAHVDTLHTGTRAEVEVYDKKGNHMYSVCPICGRQTGPRKPDYKVDV